MLKKTVILVVAALLGSSLLFAQQHRKGPANGPVRQKKPQAQKPNQPHAAKAPFGRILNALNEAYRQNDREKMGIILRKLNQAHKKMQGQLNDVGPQHMARQRQDQDISMMSRGPRRGRGPQAMRGRGTQRQGTRGYRMRGRGQGMFRGEQGRGPRSMHGMGRQRQGMSMGRPGRGFGRCGRGY